MRTFLDQWGDSAITTLSFFWMALWAFCLGYIISSMIQVFVTRTRMQQSMGKAGPKAVALGTFFGFLSSSCSFAALSSSRALFQKGAGLVPALAFLLASTNLVIELGIVIAVFLSSHFVAAEYVGAITLILVMWLMVKLTLPGKLEDQAREHADHAEGHDHGDHEPGDWKQQIRTTAGWANVGMQYKMEWLMVWKDVLFGFTIAGVIATFIPPEFFQTLFIGSGGETEPAWWQTVLHTLIGPVAAFFTFIGSMGNIPLAAVLFGSGVSFAGIMAFIFSDLVVFPMLRISAQYFGWKMAAYILGVFLVCLVVASLVMHYGFAAFDLLPDPTIARTQQTEPAERFKLDHTFFLNITFVLLSVGLVTLMHRRHADHDHHDHNNHHDDNEHQHDHEDHEHHHDHGESRSWDDWLLLVLACGSIAWLAGGVIVWAVV